MKTVIEMAREAGLFTHKEVQPELERFAELVRADERKKWEEQTAVEIHEAVLDEREACAKVCDAVNAVEYKDDPWYHASEKCAAAIRARKP